MIVATHPDGTTQAIPEDEVDAAELQGREHAILGYLPASWFGSPSPEHTRRYDQGYQWGLEAQVNQ